MQRPGIPHFENKLVSSNFLVVIRNRLIKISSSLCTCMNPNDQINPQIWLIAKWLRQKRGAHITRENLCSKLWRMIEKPMICKPSGGGGKHDSARIVHGSNMCHRMQNNPLDDAQGRPMREITRIRLNWRKIIQAHNGRAVIWSLSYTYLFILRKNKIIFWSFKQISEKILDVVFNWRLNYK